MNYINRKLNYVMFGFCCIISIMLIVIASSNIVFITDSLYQSLQQIEGIIIFKLTSYILFLMILFSWVLIIIIAVLSLLVIIWNHTLGLIHNYSS